MGVEAQDDDLKDPKKPGSCFRLCQSRWCLVLIFLAMAAGMAVSIPVVLLSSAVRERFQPDMQWWKETIIYQIYPRSFQDSDNDGVGDLQGIIDRLDHLTYLNVKTIWLSPFYPSPMRDFGYDISNYTDVDPLFGNLTDMDNLLRAAHQKGMKVLIDFVAGHTSSEHPWFKSSVKRQAPFEDYYIWANGTLLSNGTVVPPSNWMSAFGYSAWEWNAERQEYYYHAFLKEQPTLNYRNPLVVEEMKDVIRFWMERGVDGMRVDAVGCIMVSENYYQDQARSFAPGAEWWEPSYYINNLTSNLPAGGDIVKGWREVMDSFEDGEDDDTEDTKFLIVEIYAPVEVRNRYYGYGADMPFNFDLVTNLDNRNLAHRNVCDAICIHDAINNVYGNLPDGQWTNFVLSNHDNNRVASRMGAKFVDALNVLLLTLRGTPTTYYGDEIGMQDIAVTFKDTQDPQGIAYGPTRYQEVSRDPERSPMQWDNSTYAGFSTLTRPWLPVHPDYMQVNVQSEKDSSNTTAIHVYRDLAVLRKQPSLRYGLFAFADVTPSILSFVRTAVDQPRFLIVINFGEQAVTHDFSGTPVNEGQGQVKVVTSEAANEGRFKKDAPISLKQVVLEPGDGLVVELQSS